MVTARTRFTQLGALAILMAVLLLVTTPLIAGAQDYIVDQANDGFEPSLFWSIWLFAPFGQEFTPTYDHVDVVEMWSYDLQGGGIPSVLMVQIRVDVIDGPVIGTSDYVSVQPDDDGPAYFAFAAPVPVVPGERYVIRLLNTGDWNWGVGVEDGTGYPGGRIIYYGVPDETNDAWFREGVLHPTSVSARSWGAIKSLYR